MRHTVDVALATFVLVTGSGPGLGKSTLAGTLAERVRASGRPVALFAEEAIYSDPAFSRVMAEFESSGRVELATLLEASSNYLCEIHACSVEVVVLDALFAYLPSLLAWGYSDQEIAEFLERMAQHFGDNPVIELHLVGDLAGGLTRAGAREQDDWLDRHLLKVSHYAGAPQVSDTRDAAAYLEQLEDRAAALLRDAPWTVEFLDIDAGFASVTNHALTIVEAIIRPA